MNWQNKLRVRIDFAQKYLMLLELLAQCLNIRAKLILLFRDVRRFTL